MDPWLVHTISTLLTLMIISPVAVGTTLTSCATLLFALIDPNISYWAFGFLGASFSVFGADFVFAGGTMFVASIVLPHEQSLSGALFQMMTQVREYDLFLGPHLTFLIDWDCIGRYNINHCLQPHSS